MTPRKEITQSLLQDRIGREMDRWKCRVPERAHGGYRAQRREYMITTQLKEHVNSILGGGGLQSLFRVHEATHPNVHKLWCFLSSS